MARSSDAAQALDLALRPLADTLRDALAWELQSGPSRPRQAGLAPADEVELIQLARSRRAL